MRSGLYCATVLIAGSSFAVSQQPASSSASGTSEASAPAAALTIYNQDFAVARTTIDLDLRAGRNEVSTNQVTTQLEPDSVVLRDVTGKSMFQIAEQDYDAAVVTQDWLLNKYEGKTINFQLGGYGYTDGHFVTPPLVKGTIIRAPRSAPNPYGNYQQTQPLIEVDGKLQFQVPGTPLFPASTDGLLLKPTLRWQIDSDKAQKLKAELAYITRGLDWEATYNVVTGAETASGAKSASTAKEEKADVDGWVTITNRTGADFPQARIKLMAGDVAKIQPAAGIAGGFGKAVAQSAMVNPQVTQKAFDDFHLYDLNRTVSLIDGETKQVQFIDRSGVTMTRSYMYDGAEQNLQPWSNYGNIVQQQNFGLNSSNTKVQITQEIKNTEANHLGIPLPAGRARLYRRDSDGQMEFVGESAINHTPTADSIRITSGNAFDIKGSRRQTNFSIDSSRRMLNESFEIRLMNQKDEAVTVSVLEHLYRGENWEMEQKSADYTSVDSHTILFPVTVPAKGEATLNYSVRYTW